MTRSLPPVWCGSSSGAIVSIGKRFVIRTGGSNLAAACMLWMLFALPAFLMACILFIPTLQSAFRRTVLNGAQWLTVLGVSLLSVLQVETAKFVKRMYWRYKRHRG